MKSRFKTAGIATFGVLALAACSGVSAEAEMEAFDQGYEEGYEVGYEEGYQEGHTDGYSMAERELLANGIDDDDDLEEAANGDEIDAEAIQVNILEIFEPDEAEALIADENPYNEPPEEGHRYLMMRVSVTNNTPEPLTPWDLTFEAEGPEAVVYRAGCMMAVLPSPSLSDIVSISTGGTQEGHVCFEMREADALAEGERSLYVSTWDGREVEFIEE